MTGTEAVRGGNRGTGRQSNGLGAYSMLSPETIGPIADPTNEGRLFTFTNLQDAHQKSKSQVTRIPAKDSF